MTESDAKLLIALLKELLEKQVYLPENGTKKDLLLKSKDTKDEFIININRRSINEDKCTFLARTKGKNELLLRLDVNPTSYHMNPDGELIDGTHLHIFKEGFEIDFAIPFDKKTSNLIDYCISFFKEFNVLEDYEVYDNTNLKLFH